MTDDDGQAREIFLVALARMSDQCGAPNLIPECPFSVDLPSGGRGCGEECEGILAEAAPDRRPGEIALGELGFTARQRASLPKPPVPVGRAFDATEIYYHESETLPIESWSPISLLVGLKRVATQHPFERSLEQHHEALACLDQLRRKGFDVEALCRVPLAIHVATAIVADVVLRTVSKPSDPSSGSNEVDSRLDLRDAMFDARAVEQADVAPAVFLNEEGSSPIELDPTESAKVYFTVAGEFGKVIARWAMQASPEDLLDWNVVVSDEAPDIYPPEARRTAQWLFDRFTQTYLSGWEPDSLRAEWLARQHGASPITEELLAARRVDPLELATHVANLAVDGREQRIRNSRLVTSAIRLIKAGRRDAAAAMFDGVRRSDWEDPELHNNYGFCLLLDNPTGALRALDRAFRGGKRDATNRANRALCLFRLGRHAAALEVLDEAFAVWDDLETNPSWLWAFDKPDEPELLSECPRCYLVRLGERVAQASGDPGAAALWRRRAAHLVHEAE